MQKSLAILRFGLSLSLLLVIQFTLRASLPAVTPEADMDKFMADYMKGLKVAFEEKDDKKSAALVRKIKTDLTPRYNKLMPELLAWKKSMSKADIEALKKRIETKPWVKEMLTFGFNPANQQRVAKSPELTDAMTELNAAFKDMTGRDDDAEEEDTDKEDNR